MLAYLLQLLVFSLFVLFWDNKGAGSMWDKSTKDWVTFAWLASCTVPVGLSVLVSLTGKKSLMLLGILCLTILINGGYVVLNAQEEAAPSLGYPIVSGLLGACIWGYLSRKDASHAP